MKRLTFVCMGKILKEGASIYDNNVGRFIREIEILGCCINDSLAVQVVIQDVTTEVDTNCTSQVLEKESYAFNGKFGSEKEDQIEKFGLMWASIEAIGSDAEGMWVERKS
ncbi:hypothetical protein V6N13_008989 [Hibiscus sabdariffa]|uniref:Uncharacterized protein n=1 Tax=Hibiscus sabdariffa TaxID=183260 RepID=A0ABR2NRB8_9ROSI